MPRPPGWIGPTQWRVLNALTGDWQSVQDIMRAASLTFGQTHGALVGLRERQLLDYRTEGAGKTAKHFYRAASKAP